MDPLEQRKPVSFSLHERDALLSAFIIDPDLERRFTLAILLNGAITIDLTAGELKELLATIASGAIDMPANEHRRQLEALFERIQNILDVEFPDDRPAPSRSADPDFEPMQILANNTPLEDFCGLTPTEMHALLYDRCAGGSPVKLRDQIEAAAMDASPYFRLVEELLKLIQRNRFVKLTGTGALPRAVVRELYEHRFLPEEMVESGIVTLRREDDSTVIRTLLLIASLARLVRKDRGRAVLTRKGLSLMEPRRRSELFRGVLLTYAEEYNWGFNDRYPDLPIGQQGWGYSVYLLFNFGHVERPVEFYAEKYALAFPAFLARIGRIPFGTPLEVLMRCYAVRTMERFMEWFGFAARLNPGRDRSAMKTAVVPTMLLREVFTVE